MVDAAGGTDQLWGKERVVEWLMESQAASGDVVPLLRTLTPKRLTEVASLAGIDSSSLHHQDSKDPRPYLASLRGLFKAHPKALLHTHGYKANLIGRMARWSGIRMGGLIATCHGWIETSRSLRLYNSLDRWTSCWSDLVTVPSPAMVPRLSRGAVFVPNGIPDLPVPTPEERIRARRLLNLSEHQIVAGTLGRLSPEKGIDVLIKAAQLTENVPELVWAVAGTGPLEGELREAAKSLPQIRFVGYVDGSTAFLPAIDIFVQPSWSEGLSLALLEAARAALPIVATRVGATDWAVRDSIEAYLINAGDASSLGDRVMRLAREPSLRQSLSEAARRRFDEAQYRCHAENVSRTLLPCTLQASVVPRKGGGTEDMNMRHSPFTVVLFVGLMAGCQEKAVTYGDGVIASFESKDEIQPAEGTAAIRQSTEHVTAGQYSLEATLQGTESGFGFHAWSKPFNFSTAKKLYFDAYREGSPISLIFRVYDEKNNPYVVWYYRLLTGENLVEIDVSGMGASGLDLTKIKRIYMYVEEGSGKVFVDNFRCTEKPIDLESLIKRPVVHPKRVPSGNGLLNGDFEAGLAGWNSWGEWDGGLYSFGAGMNDEACSGAASMKIVCEKRGRGGIFTEPMYMPAGVYEFRFWAKGDAKDSLFRWTFVGDGNARAAVEKNVESDVQTLGTEWKEYHYTVPVNSDVALRLYFFSVGTGTVYLDAASIVLQGKENVPPFRVPESKQTHSIKVEGNRMFLNGKPFFPMGIYLGHPDALANTGFNCQMPITMTPEIVEESARTGVLLSPELTGVLRGHLPWQVGVAVKPFMNHPQLFGWYLCDEPDHAKMTVSPMEMRLATKMVHEIDPERPTWAVVMSWADSNMYQYADTVDILATDIYPIEEVNKKRPLVEVGEKTDVLKRAVGKNKPGIAVLQSTGKATPEEEIAMSYLALVHGANGLFYWQLFEAQENPEVWQAMVDLSFEVKVLTPVLTAPDFDRPTKVSDPRVHTLARRLGNRLYVLAINATPEPLASVRFSHGDVQSPAAKVLFERRDTPISGDSWTESFQPYQRHVYSIPAR